MSVFLLLFLLPILSLAFFPPSLINNFCGSAPPAAFGHASSADRLKAAEPTITPIAVLAPWWRWAIYLFAFAHGALAIFIALRFGLAFDLWLTQRWMIQSLITFLIHMIFLEPLRVFITRRIARYMESR